jgi:hypothetical protein
MNGDQAFACMDCGSRHAASGACPTCKETLLDLGDPAVRDVLLSDDQRRLERHTARTRYVAVPLAMVIVVVVCSVVPGVSQLLVRGPFFSGYVLAMIGVAFAIMKGFDAVSPFKPKFRDLQR